MTNESQKLFIAVGIFVALSLIGLVYLRQKDDLASNHYKLQALKKCEQMVEREPCEERVEKEHIGCYDAWIVRREGDVDGYARCMGMLDAKFKK